MRVCVFGAGAIGSHIAGRLAKAGAQVCVIARGDQLAAIRDSGVNVEAADGSFTQTVAASADPAAFGPQDVVIVAVKAPALPSFAGSAAPLLGPETLVVFAMNGIPWWYFHAHGGALDGRRLSNVDPGDAVWNTVGPERAIGCVVYCACTVIQPGVVRVASTSNRLILGQPDGATSGRLQSLADLLTDGGLPTQVTPRIRDAIWVKLMLNLCTGPLSVLAQADQQSVLAEPPARDAARVILAEGAAIAHALGCSIEYDPDRLINTASRLAHKSSIVQDLDLGRPMEIGALYDAPLQLARMAGVATPMLDLLVALVRLRARGAGLYSAATA